VKQKIDMREAISTALFVLIITTMVLMLASFLYCLLSPKDEVDGIIRTFNYISTGLLCITWPLSLLVTHFRAFKKGRRYERKKCSQNSEGYRELGRKLN